MKNTYLKPLFAAFAAALACLSADAETVALWGDGQMQGRSAQADTLNKRNMLNGIKTPTLELFLAKSDKPNGLVVIAPGGGYQILAYPHEGVQIAEWLNKCGISAAVLKYRVPDFPAEALADIQRAIRLVRANAKSWNVNPDKIGVMGFSAGANLCARASTNYMKDAYAPVDAADKLSARPDATCLIYPAYCSQPEKDRRFKKGGAKDGDSYDVRYKIADWNVVDKDTPPAFITQTQFDPYADASIAYYLALKEAKVPAQLHMLPVGKHGYQDKKVFEMYADWLKSNGF